MVLDQSTASLATQGTTVINADSAAPSAAEWLQNISALHLAFVIASTMATAVAIVLDFVHQYNIHYYVGNEYIQTDLYYLALYVMVCLMALVSLLRVIFGGRDHVSEYLMSKNEFIQFSTPAVLLLL
ncbi:Organic solute transporter alpha-like protein 1 [Toxocara canis]|nr:Organic solute transporter alpha-like protein 1 [Toxocara canis]